MFSRHHRKTKILFGLSDIVLVALAFELAYQTRTNLPFERVFYLVVPVRGLLLGVAALAWPLAGVWLNVYERLDAEKQPVIVRDTLRQCVVGGVAVILIEYLLRLDLSRSFLGLFLVYAWIALCLFRLNAPRLAGWFRRGFGQPYYVLVAGTGPRGRKLGEALERAADYGVQLNGFLAADGVDGARKITLGKTYAVHPLDQLPVLLAREVIDEIIFSVDGKRLSELEEVLLLCEEEGIRTRVAVDFFPHVHSDVYFDKLRTIPLLTFSAAPHDEVRLMLKRVGDVAIASASLVLLSPFMILIGLLIRLTSPGPVIFRQVRCGLNGRRFVFYKFRSMCQNAEELKPALQHLNQKRTAFKIARDPRVTALGRFLRKFSIDEWPQLWNILRGDMSLVGPRPPVPDEVHLYERWQRRRLRMRPGLTCLWALEGRDTLDFDSWIKKDLEYIDNWSLALDWKILFRTIPHVLSGKGAH
ncbi:MAG: sugar transferase [Bryobacteraceae bacterium]|nr:sugar transferase [Bryobacteraceae bacterium]